jgi:lipopolysaccharide export system permease protein
MKKLDWYILRKFISTFIFTVLILVTVLIVIDLTEKIENFRNPALTARRIIVEYYLNFIPSLVIMLSPLMIFITAVFVTSRLATHTEIVAMLSSGMSLGRIMRPYMIGATLIGLFVFGFKGWVIPPADKIRHNFEDNFVRGKFYFKQLNFHTKLSPTLYAYMERYDNTIHTGYKFTLERVEGLELKEKLETPRIFWDSTKRKWGLDQFKVRVLVAGKEKVSYYPARDTLLAMIPKDFESKHEYHQRLSNPELDAYIKEQQMRGGDNVERFIVEKYERVAYPFCIVILTAIGVIVSARKSRGGTGFQIAFGFVLAFVYIFLVIISRGFAEKGGLPPYVAVWFPNTLFTLLGILMYYRVPK